MNRLSPVRSLGLALVACALFTSACGLKTEAKDRLRTQGSLGNGQALPPGTSIDPETGEVVDESGNPVDPNTIGGPVVPGAPGATTGPTTGGPGGGPSAGPSSGPSGGPSSGPTTPAGPGNTTGIRGNKIYLALHGPLTGAGVPQDSFKSGTKLYWKTHKIRGMEVVADAFDDEYNPNGAIKACRAAAPSYFLIIGGAGTDQIQACARDQVVQRGGVPYISAGVTTNGLTALSNYFAASLTYAQQGPTVVKMAREKGYLNSAGPNGWGLVISDTPNFADARDSIQNALKAAGVKYKYYPVPKVGGSSTTVANQLRSADHEVVYFLGQPLFFAELVGKTGCPAYCPQWTGVGISMGVNTVANLACGGSNGMFKGEFLSPYPGIEKAGQLAPGVAFKDDIEFNIYGVMQMIHQMFNAVQGPLTRENMIATVGAGNFPAGIFSPTRFGGRTHFGGTAAYYLKADCGPGNTSKWVTDGGPTR